MTLVKTIYTCSYADRLIRSFSSPGHIYFNTPKCKALNISKMKLQSKREYFIYNTPLDKFVQLLIWAFLSLINYNGPHVLTFYLYKLIVRFYFLWVAQERKTEALATDLPHLNKCLGTLMRFPDFPLLQNIRYTFAS